MTLPHIEWKAKGFNILLVQAEENYYHALVSPDGLEYYIYDRFNAPSLQYARDHYHFDPKSFRMIEGPFPITRERALEGGTGIPPDMEPLMKEMEKMPYPLVESWARRIRSPEQLQ